MTIYVDQLISYPQQAKSGERYFGNGKESCHLATDGDLEELHQFATRLGLKREWLHNHKSVPHYDLTPNKRAQAVRFGAVEVLATDLVLLCSKSQHAKQANEEHPDQPLLDLLVAVRQWRDALAGPNGIAAAEQHLLAALERYEQRPE